MTQIRLYTKVKLTTSNDIELYIYLAHALEYTPRHIQVNFHNVNASHFGRKHHLEERLTQKPA